MLEKRAASFSSEMRLLTSQTLSYPAWRLPLWICQKFVLPSWKKLLIPLLVFNIEMVSKKVRALPMMQNSRGDLAHRATVEP